MKSWVCVVFVLICLLTGQDSNGQVTSLKKIDSIAAAFIKSVQAQKEEHIFVHTDKKIYSAGQDLLFKAYLVDKISYQGASSKQPIYVDLVDHRDAVIKQLLLYVPGQKTDGVISLPDSLPEGFYWLRCYTVRQLITDAESMKVIPVYVFSRSGSYSDPSMYMNKSRSGKQPVTVNFYPEGGYLIGGINCVIAFRAIDSTGMPVAVNGFVKDNTGYIETRFSAGPSGLGRFELYPRKSRSYSGHIPWKGDTLSFPIGDIDPFASQLSISSQHRDAIQLRVAYGDSLYNKNVESYILGLSNNQLVFASVGNEMYEVSVPKKDLGKDVTTFLLFNHKGEVISERSVLNNVPWNMEMQKDAAKYGKRQNVTLTFNVTDPLGKPLPSMLSVSVTDDAQVQANTDSIALAKHFYHLVFQEPLATDLFRKLPVQDQDNFMITQPFKYLHKKKSPASVFIEDDSLLAIKGVVVNKKNQPVAGQVITVFSNPANFIMQTDTTDMEGRFAFLPDYYPDSTHFILQVANEKGIRQDLEIKLDSMDYPQVRTPASLKTTYKVESQLLAEARERANRDSLFFSGKEVLREVVISSRAKKKVTYDESKRLSLFSRVITPEQLDRTGNGFVANALLRVPGVTLTGGFLTIRGGGTRSITGNVREPLIVLDGVPIEMSSDTGTPPEISGLEISPVMKFLNTLSADAIDFIEVLTGGEAAMYGTRGGNGVIIIHSGRKNWNPAGDNKGIQEFRSRGYHWALPFKYPDYSRKEMKSLKTPDLRSTVYWNGDLQTDTTGTASVTFSTTDATTSYTIKIMGVSSRGDLLYKTFRIQVE